MNGTTIYAEAFPWIEEKKLTILSNSDVHTPVMPQGPRPGRAVTLVFAKSADANGIKEALKARRSAAWMGGEIWGSEQHLRELWSNAVQFLDGGQTLRNKSAIAFHMRVRSAPPWLTVRNTVLEPESFQALRVTRGKGAPSPATAEVEVEVTNLHPGPGRNLIVRIPMSFGK